MRACAKERVSHARVKSCPGGKKSSEVVTSVCSVCVCVCVCARARAP